MGNNSQESGVTSVSNVAQIDKERIRGHLDRVVRSSVEETLNGLLDAEADRLCNAGRYERTGERRDYRSGHYERQLHTKAGEVTLKMPKLRNQTLDTAIIERYRRGESSVKENGLFLGATFTRAELPRGQGIGSIYTPYTLKLLTI